MGNQSVESAFDALGEPVRRRILELLHDGPTPVGELAVRLPVGRPAVSKHLRVLERAGLVSRGREAQWRPCKINGEGFKDVADWVERYRAVWEESFDRLDEYLKKLQTEEKK